MKAQLTSEELNKKSKEMMKKESRDSFYYMSSFIVSTAIPILLYITH